MLRRARRDRWYLSLIVSLLVVVMWSVAAVGADPQRKIPLFDPNLLPRKGVKVNLQRKIPLFNPNLGNKQLKRNPFAPPLEIIKVIEAKKVIKKEHLSPLQRYDVESLVLKGIVADVAMVLAPDGESYIIRKGTELGRHGEKVTEVYKDRVAVKRGNRVIYIKFPKD